MRKKLAAFSVRLNVNQNKCQFSQSGDLFSKRIWIHLHVLQFDRSQDRVDITDLCLSTFCRNPHHIRLTFKRVHVSIFKIPFPRVISIQSSMIVCSRHFNQIVVTHIKTFNIINLFIFGLHAARILQWYMPAFTLSHTIEQHPVFIANDHLENCTVMVLRQIKLRRLGWKYKEIHYYIVSVIWMMPL